MSDMLNGIALAAAAGPITALMEKLSGEDGELWLAAFKRFLRKEDPWPKAPVAGPTISPPPISTDYGKVYTRSELERVFDQVDPRWDEAHFMGGAPQGLNRLRDVPMEVIGFSGRTMEIIDQMTSRGYRPGTSQELLAHHCRYPVHPDQGCWIVAIGDRTQKMNGHTMVAMVARFTEGLSLKLHTTNYRWSQRGFLVVPI